MASIAGSGALTFEGQTSTGVWGSGLIQTSDPALGTVIGVNDDFVPGVDALYDIGTADHRFRALHVSEINNDAAGETLSVGNYTNDLGTTNLYGSVRGKDGKWSITNSGGISTFGATQDAVVVSTGNLTLTSPVTKSINLDSETIQITASDKVLVNATTAIGLKGHLPGDPTTLVVGQTGTALTTVTLGGAGPGATTVVNVGTPAVGNATLLKLCGGMELKDNQGLYTGTIAANSVDGTLIGQTGFITARSTKTMIKGVADGSPTVFSVGNAANYETTTIQLGAVGTNNDSNITLGYGGTGNNNNVNLHGNLLVADNTGVGVSTINSSPAGLKLAGSNNIINVGDGLVANQINLGTPGASNTINIGVGTSASAINLNASTGSAGQTVNVFDSGHTGAETMNVGSGLNTASRTNMNNVMMRMPEYKEVSGGAQTLVTSGQPILFNTLYGVDGLVSLTYNSTTGLFLNISGRTIVVAANYQAAWAATYGTSRSTFVVRNTGGGGTALYPGNISWGPSDSIQKQATGIFRLLNGQGFNFYVQSSTTGEIVNQLTATITIL